MKTKLLLTVLIASTLSTGLAGAAPQPDSFLGSAVPAQAPVDRVIVITGATRYVNVTGGTTVRFVVGERSFSWNFQNGTVSLIPFDLGRIAPQGMLDHAVTAYVSDNPLYRNN